MGTTTRLPAVMALVGLGSGCSFIAGGVPDKPPPPARCPEGVIMVDAIGSLAALAITGIGVHAIVKDDSQAAVLAIYVTPVTAAVSIAYIASTISGVNGRRRCVRMKEQEIAAWDAERAPRELPVVARDSVVGAQPLHCLVSQGTCFLDETTCATAATSAGLSCETRTSGWCFDSSQLALGDQQTTCAASLDVCQTLRTRFASDRTLSVSQCGSYSVATRQ